MNEKKGIKFAHDYDKKINPIENLNVDSLFELENGRTGQQFLISGIEDFQLHRDFAVVCDVSDATIRVEHHSLQLSARVFAL